MGQMTHTGKVLSAHTIIGDHVYNLQDEDLGKVDDLMLDTDKGCINYAVLSHGGMLGMGDKFFAVPWDALKLDTANKRFMLDVSKEMLDNAEGFDKNDWPDMPDTTFMGTGYKGKM